MGTEHTAKAFDSDLQELTRLVAEMGGLAERMIVESVDALIRRDIVLGQRVVAADAEIDNLQRVIEDSAREVRRLNESLADQGASLKRVTQDRRTQDEAIQTSLLSHVGAR